MGLLSLLVVIAVAGLLVWALTTLVPMPAPFKNAIYVIAVVVLVLYILQVFGLLSGIPNLKLVK